VSRWFERRAPLLVLRADDGSVGIGEAWSRQQDIGHGIAALVGFVEQQVIGRRFDGEDDIVALVGAAPRKSWMQSAAVSAVDIALWDLLARSRGEPLWRTLGGRTGRAGVYASGGLYRDGTDVDDLAAEAIAWRRAGFRDAKIKVGALALADDVARIRAVRSVLLPDAQLWVDAVNQLQPANALRAVDAYRAAGASAVQAPVAFDDLRTMALLNRLGLPVVAAEALHAPQDFAAMIEADAVGILQFNLALCGGFSGGMNLARAAESRSLPLTPQTHATAVAQCAALHFGAALRTTRSVEYHRFHDHLSHVLSAAARTVHEGVVTLGEQAGLGIALPAPGPQPDGGEVRIAWTS